MTITLSTIIQIFKRAALWLLLFPAVLGGTVAYLTRDMPLEFTSTATVYTGIASGYSITSSENEKIDNTTVNNAFDNLMTTIRSRETLTDVGVHLLAYHLSLTKPPRPDQLSQKSYKALKSLLNPTLKKATVPGNEEATYQRLYALLKQPQGNTVQSILYQSSTPYSLESIMGRVSSTRKANSDMLDLTSKGNDPAICQQTLTYLIQSFKQRYISFKTSETGSVVWYFEEQTKKAFQNLKEAEDRLTKYSIQNKIINYPEQSKFTAAAKEALTSEYYQEKRTLETANASLKALNGNLDDRTSILASNQAMDAKRAELAAVQTRLSNAMVYGYSKDTISVLRNTLNRVSDELKVMVQRYYNSTHTLQSVPQRELIGKYLDNTLENQGSSARLKTMQERIREFDQVYDVMAPLGSAVGRLQREIGVAEKEYLAALHSLNMSRVRQKDLEMSGAMTILDAPSLPMKPQPSSRRMLIIAACLGGIVLVLAVSFGRVLLNSSIAAPERVETLTSIPVAAALPLRLPRLKHYNLDYAEHCMLEQLLSRILVELEQTGKGNYPYHLITVFSTRPQQGKTWTGSRISDLFAENGHRVAYIHAATDAGQEPEKDTIKARSIAYPATTDFSNTKWLTAIPELETETFDYVFLELPSLLNTPIPVQLITKTDLSLFVVSARASWSKSDQELCTLYRRAAHGPIVAVLNDVEPDRLEALMGSLSKKEGLVQRIKKKLARKKKDKVQPVLTRV
ncbi:GumC family protein [Spirosoma aerophilum]